MGTAAPGSEWRPSFSPWLIAASVMLATFMEVLDTSVAAVALPHIAGNLSATTDEATWVLTSYLISNAIILPSSGWLGTFLGRKRYQLISVLVFTLASMWCGAATSLGMLVVARVVQGAAGGGLQPVSQAVLLESFPPARRGAAMAAYGMGIIVAPLVGPLLGGWITENYSWRWIFYINVPVGMVAMLMIRTFVEDPPYARRSRQAGIDYIGLGFLAVWMAAFQVVLDKGQESDWFAATWIRWFVAIVAVFLVAFIVRELRVEHPIVDLRVLKDRNLAVGTFLIGLIGVVIYGTTTLLPLFLQDLLGFPAYQSGLAVAPRGIGAIISMVIAARLVGRVDGRALICTGLVIRAASLFMLGDLNLSAGMSNVVWPNIVNGLANGFLFVPLTTMSMETLPKELISHGTGLYNLLRNMGASFGISIVATMLARDAQRHQAIMISHLTPYSFAYRQALVHLEQLGLSSMQALGIIGRGLEQQATLWAYIDDFRLLGILTVACLPFVLLFRKGGKHARTPAAH
jgi:DHA2 family multidrug resistance protein